MRAHLARLGDGLALGVALATFMLGQNAAALPVMTGAVVNVGGGQPFVFSNDDDLVTIDLNAQRTIIDWANFDLLDHEFARFYFEQRNWIVLNRVTGGPINIDGVVEGIQAANFNSSGPIGGNVWFYSPQGVVFGPSTRVNVGGLLATSAAVNQTAFLNTGNLNIPFTGTGSGGPVTIDSGAQFIGQGHLAFIAPRVASAAGATINAGDLGTAAYGGVDSYEIQFIPIGNNDLAFFTFLVPGVAAGSANPTPLDLAGTTTGANVYLSAISRSQLGGLLINAPGLLVGASSVNEYGQVTITTGRNITLGQVNESSSPVVGAQTGDIRVGTITASGNVNLVSTGTSGAGNVTADRLQIGQASLITANNLTVGPQGIRTGDSNVFGGGLNLNVSGVVNVPLVVNRVNFNVFSNQFQFNGSINQPSRGADLRFGTVNTGGAILLADMIAITTQSLTAGGNLNVFNAGSFTANAISSGRDILITGANGALDIGSATAVGQSQMFSNATVRLGTLTTNGYTRVSASQTIVATSIRGIDLDIRSAGGVTATTLIGTNSVSLGTGGDANVSSISGPSLLLDAETARLGTVTVANDTRLRVRNLDLTGALSSANLTIESKTGLLTVGGANNLDLSQAEFDRIRVSGVLNIYGGFTAPTVNVPTPIYGDVTLRDLTIDPTRVPTLNVFAHNSRNVIVIGTVRPTASGGIVRIGDATANSIWLPDQIRISGALGSASGDAALGFTDVRAFGSVDLRARRNILIGSDRFIDLVDDADPMTIDIAAGQPPGVAPVPDEVGRLFVVSGSLAMGAGERIVQQNTGGLGGERGFYLTGDGVSPSAPILSVGGAQVVDVFGTLKIGDALVSGQQAVSSGRIARLEGDLSTGEIRINGCPLGIGCVVFTPAQQFRLEQFRPATAVAALDPPVLSPPPPVDDDERETETVTTGAGNEEIWRRPR